MNKKLKFIGASKEQLLLNDKGNSKKMLIVGDIYEMEKAHVVSNYVGVELTGFPGMMFNGVCFEIVKE